MERASRDGGGHAHCRRPPLHPSASSRSHSAGHRARLRHGLEQNPQPGSAAIRSLARSVRACTNCCRRPARRQTGRPCAPRRSRRASAPTFRLTARWRTGRGSCSPCRWRASPAIRPGPSRARCTRWCGGPRWDRRSVMDGDDRPYPAGVRPGEARRHGARVSRAAADS